MAKGIIIPDIELSEDEIALNDEWVNIHVGIKNIQAATNFVNERTEKIKLNPLYETVPTNAQKKKIDDMLAFANSIAIPPDFKDRKK